MEPKPFPHLILDDWACPELCRAALVEWPAADWPHWLRYEGPRGNKLATKDALRIPPACAELIRQMLCLPIKRLTGIDGTFPDPHLHGAGMHSIPPGGNLPLHLDGDHNPVTGHERALSGVLFLNDEWPPGWGGCLQLWDQQIAPIVHIAPQAGRLVLFECGDNAYHAVSPVSRWATRPRCTLSVFWWRMPTRTFDQYSRPRAEFV